MLFFKYLGTAFLSAYTMANPIADYGAPSELVNRKFKEGFHLVDCGDRYSVVVVRARSETWFLSIHHRKSLTKVWILTLIVLRRWCQLQLPTNLGLSLSALDLSRPHRLDGPAELYVRQWLHFHMDHPKRRSIAAAVIKCWVCFDLWSMIKRSGPTPRGFLFFKTLLTFLERGIRHRTAYNVFHYYSVYKDDRHIMYTDYNGNQCRTVYLIVIVSFLWSSSVDHPYFQACTNVLYCTTNTKIELQAR